MTSKEHRTTIFEQKLNDLNITVQNKLQETKENIDERLESLVDQILMATKLPQLGKSTTAGKEFKLDLTGIQ